MRDGSEEKIRLLLAEDDTTNQYVFRAILSAAGYEVEIVEHGLAALERALERPPRLILLDMMMPVMDGGPYADPGPDRQGDERGPRKDAGGRL